jgi:hypothetical protein
MSQCGKLTKTTKTEELEKLRERAECGYRVGAAARDGSRRRPAAAGCSRITGPARSSVGQGQQIDLFSARGDARPPRPSALLTDYSSMPELPPRVVSFALPL